MVPGPAVHPNQQRLLITSTWCYFSLLSHSFSKVSSLRKVYHCWRLEQDSQGFPTNWPKDAHSQQGQSTALRAHGKSANFLSGRLVTKFSPIPGVVGMAYQRQARDEWKTNRSTVWSGSGAGLMMVYFFAGWQHWLVHALNVLWNWAISLDLFREAKRALTSTRNL